MRIAQVANFVTPNSGGLRTVLGHLAEGYGQFGHHTVQVLPGEDDRVVDTPWGRQAYIRSPVVPGTGYRVVLDPVRVRRVLDHLQPDVIEVHDRTTLRGIGGWARDCGVPSLFVSHERVDRWLRQWLPRILPLTAVADRSNASLAAAFDTVVCTTRWAAQEFERIAVPTVIVPLGVDHERFAPRLDPRPECDNPELRLLLVSRLSREKRPDLAVDAVRELVRRRVPVRLEIAGDGPMRNRIARSSRGLPVQLRGFVAGSDELAALMADADVVLAPGPVETFGLAAVEALACGTPVVVNRDSALPDVVGDAGRAVPSSGVSFADAVQDLVAVDELQRRRAAHEQSLQFRWPRTVEGFLRVHAGHRAPIAP